MLIDDILARQILPDEGTKMLADAMAKTERFSLTPNFTAAALPLCTENMEARERLLKLLPLCRPPAPVTWIEVSQADRMAYGWGKNGQNDPVTQPVKRVGILIETGTTDGVYLMTLFWSSQDQERYGWSTAACSVVIDLSGKTEFVDDLIKLTSNRGAFPEELLLPHEEIKRLFPSIGRVEAKLAASSPDTLNKWAILARRAGTPLANRFMCLEQRLGKGLENLQFVQALLASSIGDWGGEVDFWMVVLAMLASKNLCELEKVEYDQLNRRRAKAGKAPLMSHRLCRIDRRVAAKIKAAGGGHGDGMRAHFVRGHFKQRATGLFWWHPFMRGRPELGTVSKDYRVVA